MKILKPNYKWNGKLSTRSTTKYIVLHHAEAKKCSAEDVHRWHLNNGWTGIGYHFFIRKDGTIYEGRPIHTVGAHCSGHNNISIGVCCEGSFMSETMQQTQYNAVIECLQYIKKIYPNAIIKGHKELTATNCPGDNFPLSDLKNMKVSEEVDGMPYYEKLSDIPESYRPTVQKYVNMGVVKGNNNGLHLSEDMCRTLVYIDRILK